MVDEEIERLKGWLSKNGVFVDDFPLSLSSFGGAGRGFEATRDIDVGEVLVAISSNVLLAADSINNTAFRAIGSHPLYTSLKNNVALCLVLACERFIASNDSLWSPYYPVLPDDYTISSNFTETQVQMLQNNDTISEVHSRGEAMLEAYESILPLLKSIGKELTQEQFTWAWGVVQTRACYRTDPSNSHGSILVPWADFLNHSVHVDTEAYFDATDNKMYKMVTKTVFKKGEQVYISYGKHANPVLLHYYGFAIENNPEDIIHVDITQTSFVMNQLKLKSATSGKHKILSPVDLENKKLWLQKEGILSDYGLGIQGKFTMQMGDPPLSWNLLTVARVIHASAQEIRQQEYVKVFDDEIISVANELAVCKFFIGIAENLLGAYKTTSDDDNALLASETLPFVEKCIIITRKQEKLILRHVIEFCKNKVASMT